MRCGFKYCCQVVTNDSLCNDFAETCRIQIAYLRNQNEAKAQEECTRRKYELNDIGLLARINNQPHSPN
jgi:hypothetical protein